MNLTYTSELGTGQLWDEGGSGISTSVARRVFYYGQVTYYDGETVAVRSAVDWRPVDYQIRTLLGIEGAR